MSSPLDTCNVAFPSILERRWLNLRERDIMTLVRGNVLNLNVFRGAVGLVVGSAHPGVTKCLFSLSGDVE